MKARALVVVAVAFLMSGSTAFAGIITFDDLGLVHGEIVTTQMPGVTISAFNDNTEAEIAAVFNTELTGSTPDPDLQRNPPGSRNNWATGNLPSNTNTGFALFIPENTEDLDNDGVLDFPDDEGLRPAGSLIFEFAAPITTFGFDLVDVEGTSASDEPGFVVYSGLGGFRTVDFFDFIARDGAIYGDASLNRIAPLLLEFPSTRVEIFMGGSGAVDNIVFDDQQLPEPGTLTLLGLGLLGFGGAARLRRRR